MASVKAEEQSNEANTTATESQSDATVDSAAEETKTEQSAQVSFNIPRQKKYQLNLECLYVD